MYMNSSGFGAGFAKGGAERNLGEPSSRSPHPMAWAECI